MLFRSVLEDGLAISGIAVDALSGVPVEELALNAARVRGLDHAPRSGVEASRSSDVVFGRDLGDPELRVGGRFKLSGLDEGVYRIELQSPGHTRWCSAEIELRRGTEPTLTACLEHGWTIAGTIRGPDGRALTGARVRLLRAAANGAVTEFPVHGTRSDRGGGYALAHVPSGAYWVSAEAAGFAQAQVRATIANADPGDLDFTLEALFTSGSF